jgi:very-short-patch-repair endonuclease
MPTRRPIPGGLLRELAREMRRKPTDAEKAAWTLLRNRRCLGLKFRRQHIIAGYIVDFYCAELRVAIEIDGRVHEEPHQKSRDEERTWAIRHEGIDVVRIRNDALTPSALKELLAPYMSRSPERSPPSPYHGEGDRG